MLSYFLVFLVEAFLIHHLIYFLISSGRKYCSLGRLSHETGWKYQGLIETLEEKRKAKSQLYYKAKKQAEADRQKAIEEVAAA